MAISQPVRLRGLLLAIGLVLAGGWMIMSLFHRFTDSMLFYPVRGQWRTPAALGLEYEEVWLRVNGERVQGWWLAGGAGPVILMFHGNAGTIADRLENARLMIERLDASVFLAEYPGYGDSTGRPSESSLFAAGRAGLEATKARADGRPLVLFGRSLGGAVAIELAANEPVAALIVESSFTSLADLAAALGFPFARMGLPYRFDSEDTITRVTVPLLVLHGERDEIVPHGMGRRLFEAAVSAPQKRFHTIAGASHNDTVIVGGETYWSVWRSFLAQL